VIAQAAVSDSGIYQCWAENIAGYATLTARVLVQISGMQESLLIIIVIIVGPGNGSPSATNVVVGVVVLLLGVVVITFSKY